MTAPKPWTDAKRREAMAVAERLTAERDALRDEAKGLRAVGIAQADSIIELRARVEELEAAIREHFEAKPLTDVEDERLWAVLQSDRREQDSDEMPRTPLDPESYRGGGIMGKRRSDREKQE